MKYLKLFELYSDHRYHHEKLDDLLDAIQPILDEFNIVESSDRLFVRRQHMGQELPLEIPTNYRFSYAKDDPHIQNYDGIIISSIGNFEKGQQILKKLESMAPKLEKLIGFGIGIQTSNDVSTPLLRYEYIRAYKKTGEEPGHPYIMIYLNPEENFSGIIYA